MKSEFLLLCILLITLNACSRKCSYACWCETRFIDVTENIDSTTTSVYIFPNLLKNQAVDSCQNHNGGYEIPDHSRITKCSLD